MKNISYALGLHMHQPPDNLRLLIESNEWEAQQIIRCYERAARYAHKYSNVVFLHAGFSGILLEQFKDPDIVRQYKKYVDIPKMLESYRTAKNIEIIGMGYYHPIFPLIPMDDWKEQLKLGRDIIYEAFGQRPKGFWPSEMAFCMEMIPALREVGYEYVIIDHVHIQPVKKADRFDYFKPYIARYDDAKITIIPRNRDLSNAQESGLNPAWFLNEVSNKVNEFPSTQEARLLTTWSDGENGGWFRQIDEKAGFFGYFFAPLMEMIKAKQAPIRSTRISDFIKEYPAKEEVYVCTGAWNVGSTSGHDFSQWNGSESQKKAIRELFKASARYWELKNNKPASQLAKRLEDARQFILDAETSCYLFWGEAWLPKIYDKLNAANELLR